MKPGDLVRVTGLKMYYGDLGIIISEPTMLTRSTFYYVMLADNLDFLREDWLELINETR